MTTSIHTWLESTFPTPPPEEHSPPSPSLKRKRAMSLSSIPPVPASDGSSTSPKRQRVDDDVVQPYQSASQLGANPLALTERSVFSPPSRTPSARRSASPTRETPIILRSALPPVLTESLNGLKDPPPAFVEQLGDRLVKGVDGGFIPQGLRDTIRNDPDVGYQITKTVDFDQDDSRSSEQLSNMWQEVKTIFLNARDCKDGSRDENAWCDDVVRPLLHLAIKIHGNGKWWFQNVQSQSINPAYLSTIPTSSPDPSRRKTIDRKTDFALSYSHRDPEISLLYKQLDDANNPNISHTLDTFTKRTALFSGFEVKPASGDHTEAELQMSIWIAASLRKKRELACMAHPSEPVILAEPALTIVGHEHSIYYAYPRREAGRNGIHVLGPDVDRFERLSTDSIRGIFRLVRMYGNLLEYGMDKSKDGYWGGFLKPILDSLANVT